MNRLAELIADYNENCRGLSEEPMTQARLARIVGLHEVTVHRHVTGKTEIDLSQAAAYSLALGCDMEALLGKGAA